MTLVIYVHYYPLIERIHVCHEPGDISHTEKVPEVDPPVSQQTMDRIKLIYVTASLNSAIIRCPPKISITYLCHPSPNWSTVICIPNFIPSSSITLVRFHTIESCSSLPVQSVELRKVEEWILYDSSYN